MILELPTRATTAPPYAARVPDFHDAAPDADQRFRAQRVAVIGAGGIGGRVATLLARAGVGELLVVDDARLKAESVLTHEVEAVDVGRFKAEHTAWQARRAAPGARVRFACASLQDLPLAALADVDVAVLASDNLAAELAAAEATRRRGVRLVQASLHGPTLTAEVRSVANDCDAGPCLACAWAARDLAALDAGTRFECVPDGSRRGPAKSAVPTRTTAELCAAAAALAAQELRRRALGLSLAPDVVITWSGYTLGALETPLGRRDGCPADHARWRFVPLDGLATRSPRAALEVAGLGGAGLAAGSFELEGHCFAPRAVCEACSRARHDVFLPAEAARAGDCSTGTARCACGGALSARGPRWREAPLDALGTALDRPLRATAALPLEAPAAVLRVDGRVPVLLHPTPRPRGAPR